MLLLGATVASCCTYEGLIATCRQLAFASWWTEQHVQRNSILPILLLQPLACYT